MQLRVDSVFAAFQMLVQLLVQLPDANDRQGLVSPVDALRPRSAIASNRSMYPDTNLPDRAEPKGVCFFDSDIEPDSESGSPRTSETCIGSKIGMGARLLPDEKSCGKPADQISRLVARGTFLQGSLSAPKKNILQVTASQQSQWKVLSGQCCISVAAGHAPQRPNP